MQDVVRFWLEEYHVDGFRFDWVGGVEWDPLQPQREGFDPYYGIAPIARAARETAPTCYLIGEYWPIHGTQSRQDRVPAGARNRHRRGVERRIPSYAGAAA